MFLFCIINQRNYNAKKSLCIFNNPRIKNRKICRLPCTLTSNYSFPHKSNYNCGNNKMYILYNTTIKFLDNIKLMEYWFVKNNLLITTKYFTVLYYIYS